MNFQPVYIIYGSVALLGLVSILLCIINFINLSSTSSSINVLQAEIEKKTAEFDSIKKSLIESKAQAPAQVVPESAKPPQDQLNEMDKQQNIEIVRNVRSGFSSIGEQSHLEQATYDLKDKQFSHYIESSPENQPQQNKTVHNPAATNQGRTKGTDFFGMPETQQAGYGQQQIQKRHLSIPLYSQAVKDADFKTLWSRITEALQNPANLHITLDFNQILFMYEKELQYLRKIHQIVQMQNVSISFINCGRELEAMFGGDPVLAGLIQRE